MKKIMLEQILEKCSKLYKEQDEELENKEEEKEEVEEKCKVKECSCEQKAFFGVNYKK